MEKSLGIIISVAVAILIGVILVTIIAEQTITKTKTASYTDTVNLAPLRGANGEYNYTLAESNKLYADKILSHSAGAVPWKSQTSDCAITTVTIKNSTGSIASSANDYTWVEDGNGGIGWLRVKNSTYGPTLGASSSNTATITYTTCPNEYVASSWGRTVLDLVPGFFVLAILLGAAFVIFYILKQEGIVMDF